MALPPLSEARGPQRDGTAQGERPRSELAPGAIGIDERDPADLIRFARRFASQLMWYGPDNKPGGWWATPESDADLLPASADDPPRGGAGFFDGIGPDSGGLSYAEAAAFAANPDAFPDDRYAPLRRPHMALFLTAIRLLRHGQSALNGLVERHLDFQMRDVLGLTAQPAVPDVAHVLFELAPGVAAAEAPAGLRLLAGRDARHRDKVYRLDEAVIVNRAKVAALSSTFVDRQIIELPEARRSITGTPEEEYLFLLSLALGDPNPGDPLPPFGGAPLTQPRIAALAQFIGFAPTGLFMQLFELRALMARKAKRANEPAEWAQINKILEAAGKAKSGDPNFKLDPADPADFNANLAKALGGAPDLAGLPEVVTVDDLALHLDRADVLAAIKAKLFMDPVRQFTPMMAIKRAIDTDWSVVNAYLQVSGRRKRNDPNWTLVVAHQAAFPLNVNNALAPLDFAAAGTEAGGVTDLDTYLARIMAIEAYFLLPAEDVATVAAAFGVDEGTPDGARQWAKVYALLAGAHGRKVRAQGAAALRQIRVATPAGKDGLIAELQEALGDLPPDSDWQEALGRYAAPDDVTLVLAALAANTRTNVDWDSVDAILEEAQRKRLRLPEPVARKEHWRALYAYADARTAAAGDAASAWRTFGGIPVNSGPDVPPAAIGWALASPALALSGGVRTITLTLGFHADGGGPLVAPIDDHSTSAAKLPFTVALSGVKGWTFPTATFAEVSYSAVPGAAKVDATTPLIALQVTIALDETAPEIAASADTVAFGATPWPVLRLLLRPVWDDAQGHWDTAYERFRGLKLARVFVNAATGTYAAGTGAAGLFPAMVETETGIANGKKPFEPFGPQPSLGSELAISHKDLLNKRLTDIGLNFEWLGGPSNLGTWYTNYDARNFVAAVSVVDDDVKTLAFATGAALFSGGDATKPVRIAQQLAASIPADPVTRPLPPDVRSWRRYIKLALSGTDFGHHTYASLATSKSIALANTLRQGTIITNPSDFAVNQPYTPKFKRLSLDFNAAHEIDLEFYDSETAIDRLFHVEPFGVAEATADDAGWPMLPDFSDEGALYIGLSGVEAPQPVSLLFAGVESGGAEERAGALTWSWLSDDDWQMFVEPPDDDTDGLIKRGIVRFDLPVAVPSVRMPGGLYWLRATMADNATNACDLIDIHAQAGATHFVDDGAPPEHYLAPLPAKSIKTIGDAVTGIARVTQPYPSGGGVPAETDSAFRARASERLRHKGRALTLWDYERLTLAHFPQIHKVKCLPAQQDDDTPGTVRLVVIPDIRGQDRADPFSPRAPARLLDEVAAYLQPLMPPAAQINVGHPSFVRVRVRLGVRFYPGGDEAFNKRRLSERLNIYLAPWAYDEGADIAIGQRINATSIVAFVDSLPFVDFVGGCRLFTSENDGTTFHPGGDNGDWAEASREDGVLTPASQHEIDVIDDDLFVAEEFSGVGYMKVELDFVVG
jgi:hypothetical protein